MVLDLVSHLYHEWYKSRTLSSGVISCLMLYIWYKYDVSIYCPLQYLPMTGDIAIFHHCQWKCNVSFLIQFMHILMLCERNFFPNLVINSWRWHNWGTVQQSPDIASLSAFHCLFAFALCWLTLTKLLHFFLCLLIFFPLVLGINPHVRSALAF